MKTIPTLLTAALLTATTNIYAIDLPSQPYLPLSTAQSLADIAMKKCTADGYNVSVAVVDAAGLTRVILRADNTGPHTVESSRKKAFTATSMGRPTADIAALINKKPVLNGLRDMDPNLLILGGGLPLIVKGSKVGGIGVGGAPGGHLDQACAQAAIDSVLK